DEAAAERTTLRLRPGLYRSGSLFLKSGMTLLLDRDATLLGSQNLADYPVIPTRVAGIEMPWPAALLNVCEQQDVAILGEGCIDGDGKVFWDSYWRLREQYEPRGLRWASDYDAQRPRLLQLFRSARVRIGEGLQLRRSGFWTLHCCYSKDITIDGITIRNNEGGHGPSTDGVDIDSSRRVLVQNADIAGNDDAIVIKAGRDADGLRVARPTEDVIVRDCIVREGAAGITFGSETSGGFRNIEASRITVLGAVPVGILFKSAPSRGGVISGIRLSDFRLDAVPVALRITMNWNPSYSSSDIPANEREVPAHWRTLAAPVSPEQGMARVSDVQISGLRARGAQTAFEVDAYEAAPLQGFRFHCLDIEAERGGHIQDARDWQFSDCSLRLGEPIAVGTDVDLQGLAPDCWQRDAALKRRDVSSLSDAEQDIL
ncbi:MAG TPA: glycosyl hydrolase family 28 protein, partial [Burkholderiaceae bacterium]